MIPFSDEELQVPVQNIIDTKVAPIIKKDGGDIKLLKIKDGKVFVQLRGACIGCASSSTTLKFTVEKEIKAMIHPEIEIVNVPLGQEDTI
jgi:Fe-S cluster biogenesis protein NfuA